MVRAGRDDWQPIDREGLLDPLPVQDDVVRYPQDAPQDRVFIGVVNDVVEGIHSLQRGYDCF